MKPASRSLAHYAKPSPIALCLTCMSLGAFAQSDVSSTFATSEGFTTGGTAPVTVNGSALDVTVSGGQQQQSFDGPSYNTGPDAYLFISGPSFTGSFGGTTPGTGDTGDLVFSKGVTEASLFAANRGFGAATTLRAYGVDQTTFLGEVQVSQTSIRDSANPTPTVFTADALGGLIGRVEIDNPGPNANPPYVTAIDTLAATRANRYDESINGDLTGSGNPGGPTAIALEQGSNVISGSVSAGSSDTRDYFTFTLDTGESLESIELLEYEDPDNPGLGNDGTGNGNRGFYALFDGAVDPLPASGNNLGGDHLDPLPFASDLLAPIAGGGISSGTGFNEIGAGTYTFLVQQTGPQVSEYLLDFEVVPEPTSLALLGIGCVALAGGRGRRIRV